MAETYPHPKMTFGQWVANVWYYHKWMILFGAVVVFGIVIASAQFFSRVEPDASILYVGPRVISEQRCEEITGTTEALMQTDPNGDGKKKIEIRTVTLSTQYASLIGNERPGQTEYDAYMDYQNEVLAGDACLLLLDPLFYGQLEEDGALMPLSDAIGSVPEGAKKCGIALEDLLLYRRDGFSALAPETLLCFRYASAYSVPDEDERMKLQNEALAVFRDLINAG